MSTRSNWVDYSKGIGIILMVYAHLLSSAYHGGIDIPAHFFKLSDSIIYSFHMPFFFFLSGLFVEGSLRKRGMKEYLTDKLLRIFYPYLVWSIFQLGVEIIFSSQTQQGATLSDMAVILYRPWGQFWFLYALLIMHVLYAGFSRLGRYSNAIMFVAAAILFLYPLPTGIMALRGFSAHFIFFVSGVLFGKYFMQAEKYEIPLWVVILLLGILIGSGYFVFERLINPVRLFDDPHPLYFLSLSIIGTVACSALAQYLARKGIAKFLQTLGTYSLQIYLVHMLAGVGMRMVLLFAGVQNWVAHIVIGTVFALVAPIILQKLSDRLNFPYLFELKIRE
ncbi:MAG: acyltransferase [Chloroflexi bacterium]|nr:acyltransferase [Chloroflexota bacterium]